MDRKISICVNFDDDAQMEKIISFCREKGFTPKAMSLSSLDREFISESEVLFGFFPRSAIKEAVNLKWFQCSYAGVDKFSDPLLYHSPDVILTNSKGAYGTTIAEHMLCETIMMMRKFPLYMENQKNHVWKNLGEIKSVCGCTAAVIGFGDIGENFAKRLKAMGAYVRGVRRDKTRLSPYCDIMFSKDEIDEAIRGADVVALSMPGTKEASHTMTRERFSLMKKGSYFLNVGRGNAVDEEALFDSLKSGHLAGAALDVFEREPIEENSPIWDVPNLIVTPHIAGNTTLSLTRENIIKIFQNNMECYLKGENMHNTVNLNKGY